MDVAQFRSQAGLGYVARGQGDNSLARKCLCDVVCATRDYDYKELVQEWLPLAALLAADDDQPERSMELYSLARHLGFVNNSRYWEEMACRELDKVRASMPPELAAAAEARGRKPDPRETVEELLLELSHLTSV
jgi:hypothetical protein